MTSLGKKLAIKLTKVYAGVVGLSIVLILILVFVIDYNIRKINIGHSEQLLENAIATQLEYFEFTSTVEILKYFNQVLGYPRVEILDQYGYLRGETGVVVSRDLSKRYVHIENQYGDAVGKIVFWGDANMSPFTSLHLLMLLSLVLILLLLEIARRYVARLLKNQVLTPLGFLKYTMHASEADQSYSFSQLQQHPEFHEFAIEYQEIKAALLQEVAIRERAVEKRWRQTEILQQVLAEAGIAISHLNQSGQTTEPSVGARNDPVIDAVMQLRKFSYVAVNKCLELAGAKVSLLAGSQASSSNESRYTLNVESMTGAFWKISLVPLKDGGCALLAQDETELHQAEIILRHSQKMEALGNLIGGVSHDFKNFLAIILGSLEQLIYFSDSPDFDRNVAIERAISATGKATNVVDNLLAYSRKSVMEYSNIEPDELFSSLEILIQSAATPGLKVLVDINTQKNLYLDKALLESALLNLAINASHAMNGKGEIQFVYREGTLEEKGVLYDQEDDVEVVVISVCDNGDGIPHHVLNKVCDPFYTTKEKSGGSGLGLAMVSGFVRQSQGAFSITNNKHSKGVTAKLILPLLKNQSLSVAKDAPLWDSEMFLRKTILIVEDDRSLLEMYKSVFVNIGCVVKCASNIDEAEKILKANVDGCFDSLITDHHLPDGTGIEFMLRFREVNPHGRVILVSGSLQEIDGSDEALLDIDEVFSKPVRVVDLVYKTLGIMR